MSNVYEVPAAFAKTTRVTAAPSDVGGETVLDACGCGAHDADGRKAVGVDPDVRKKNLVRLRRIEGQVRVIRSPADAVAQGIVYVPEDRGRQGAITALPIFQNVSLPSLRRTSRQGFLQPAKEFALAREYTERLDLRASSLSQPAGTLSGGNQQKVVIAKWLATSPRVIILDEPTKGIDIGSKAAVHAFMGELVAQGLAVIMVSSELPEILGMSDRVAVMREGRIARILDNRALDAVTLVETAAGIAEKAA